MSDEGPAEQAEGPPVGESPLVMPLSMAIESAIDVGEAPEPLRDIGVYEAPPRRDVEVYEPAPLSGAAPSYLEIVERRRRRGYLLGGVSVAALGLALFVVIATGLSVWGTLFLVPGVLLLVLASAWRPYYWLYLPGFALLGYGLGAIVDAALTPRPDVWLSWIGFGAGLLVAYVVRRLQGRHAHWLTPVAGAIAVGAGLLAGVNDPWQIVWKGWPLILVAIGVALVARALTMGRRKRGGSGPPAVR